MAARVAKEAIEIKIVAAIAKYFWNLLLVNFRINVLLLDRLIR